MKKPKIFSYFIFYSLFIFIFLVFGSFLCFFQNYAWSFETTLTIQVTDCPSQQDSPPENSKNSIKLVFGLDETECVSYAPPPTPDSCIKAFFNRNDTYMIIDDINRIDCINWHPNGLGWTKIILPFPSRTCENWRANWGVKIIPISSKPVSLLISWDPNALIHGPFELSTSERKINMHEKQEIVLENITNRESLEISYSPDEPLSVMSIVCVGGSKNDIKCDLNPFLSLGAYAYKIFKNNLLIDHKNNLRFIYFEPFYDIEGNNSNVIYSEGLRYPKKIFEKSIIGWVGNRWINNQPRKAILIIYLVDHGVAIYEENGKVFLDPLNPNRNEQGLTGAELNDWLMEFERKIKNSVIEYEIYIVVEACFSKSFVNPLRSENRILVASALENEPAVIISEEESSFTWFFLEGIEIFKCSALTKNRWSNSFNYAKEKLRNNITSVQTPYFWSCEDCSPLLIDEFLLSGLDVPIIKKIEIDQEDEDIDTFTLRPSFTVYADCSIDHAWASIIPPDCLHSYCRIYTNPNECDCDANHCTFSPDYNFCLPGTKVYIYAKGNDTDVSVPYLVDPNLIVSPMPSDVYEEDDTPYQANLFSVELQQTRESQAHSFHNPNDVDWFKFFIFSEIVHYAIELKVNCPLSVDPNTSPFYIGIIKDEEIKQVKRLNIYHNNQHGNTFYYLWENVDKNAMILNLKIAPLKECCGVFPYRIYIYPANAPGIYYIRSKVNKYIKEKIEKKIHLSPNCLEDPISALWITSSFGDKNLYCDPEYFYFKLIDPVCSSYSLYVGEEKRGPDIHINKDNFIILNPNEFFTDMEIPREDCDQDHDIITYPKEIIYGTDPNSPEIILHSGMNLFRYPFWASYSDGNSIKNGVNLNKIFFRDNTIDPYNIKIYIYSDQEGSWYFHDQSSSDILLENKSGCLIYLDSNQNEQAIPLPDKPGQTFKEALDSKKAKIELYPGLNLIGFVGYKACFGPLMPLSERYLDSHSALYSLAETPSVNNSPSFSTIMRYDNVKGEWQHNSLFFSGVSGENFPLQADEAYLIYTKELNKLKDPNINLSDPNDPNMNDPEDSKRLIWSPSEILKQ